LNDSQEYPFTNIFFDNQKVCKSDSDEQLLLTIGYQQAMRIKSIKVVSQANGPKTIKIFVNSPNLEFDTAEEKVASQILNLTSTDLNEDSKPIILDPFKFSSVESITIFVVNNQSNSSTTEISRLILNGSKG